MFAYKNGTYTVMILDDGTKIRYNKSDIYIPTRVESMDIKITNQCDMGCPMCHENSTQDGKHSDLLVFGNDIINSIPSYTELAIGGGNPLSHPHLEIFLKECKRKNIICNITVNKFHFVKNIEYIKYLYNEKLINGIGVSVFDINNEEISLIKDVGAVCHVIIGVTPLEVLKKLANKDIKILVLGYKHFRRGITFYNNNQDRIDFMIASWKVFIANCIEESYYSIISFDNLAINQLNLENILTKKEWDSFFMGDDGIDGEFNSASMYIDLVEKKFCKNSCCRERFDCEEFDNDVSKMFNFLLKNNT